MTLDKERSGRVAGDGTLCLAWLVNCTHSFPGYTEI